MSDTENDDVIETEPPDPLRGEDDTVAKTGERLQEEAEDQEGEADPS
jgi:hypothetical protein